MQDYKKESKVDNFYNDDRYGQSTESNNFHDFAVKLKQIKETYSLIKENHKENGYLPEIKEISKYLIGTKAMGIKIDMKAIKGFSLKDLILYNDNNKD